MAGEQRVQGAIVHLPQGQCRRLPVRHHHLPQQRTKTVSCFWAWSTRAGIRPLTWQTQLGVFATSIVLEGPILQLNHQLNER